MDESQEPFESIAIVGFAGRFPKANNVNEFWQNLCQGVEGTIFFTDEELLETGIPPDVLSHPDFVKAGCMIEGIDLFDAAFFGYNPREAEMMDPQQRLFLECAWHALEHAGHDPDNYPGAIAVYAGVTMNGYLLHNILANPEAARLADGFQTIINNDKDFIATRTSYKFNLRGPSFTVQTACSTSLVGVSLACQSLLNYESDMALVGASSLGIPVKAGYFYEEGGVFSPDGYCRAFDAKGKGFIGGDGVAVVVLKRLSDAVTEGNTIYAVIKGAAINNDGANKIGFTAPSIQAQAEVIAMAQAIAGVTPETISYIEAHGTATPLGDPIEIAALNRVFQENSDAKQYCAIGSVKTNIGHLDVAAGVTGLIKTALSLYHQLIPPSLHFEEANPAIDFENSPFFVNKALSPWKEGNSPRRAGVSSFGIGGTNAHTVLEEAPSLPTTTSSRPYQLLLLSAKTEPALEAVTNNLCDHLNHGPIESFADVAFTLQVGRQPFAFRRMVVCQNPADAQAALSDPSRAITRYQPAGDRPLAFMFPGGGAQYANMGHSLYELEPRFRQIVDQCADLLLDIMGYDIRHKLYGEDKETTITMARPTIGLPALFTIEYAMAQLWLSWGLEPTAFIGHSLGEYVAACLAGVLSLEDALKMVAERSRLFETLPSGAMLSVSLPSEAVAPFLSEELAIAAINSPEHCVISGPEDAITALAETLQAQEVEYRSVQVDVAAHSPQVEPILDAFEEFVAGLTLHPPKKPYISTLSGDWADESVATARYWRDHLRGTVRFAQGLNTLLLEPGQVLLEVGPGWGLSSFARRHPSLAHTHVVTSCMPHPRHREPEHTVLLRAVGQLWLAGISLDWSQFYAAETRRRIPLPLYPFERQRYWIEPAVEQTAVFPFTTPTAITKKAQIRDWFYLPAWQPALLPPPSAVQSGDWLIFGDDTGLGTAIKERLEQMGNTCTLVIPGNQFAQLDEQIFTINPIQVDDYRRLVKTGTYTYIVHLWSLNQLSAETSPWSQFQGSQKYGFYSVICLAQALGKQFNQHISLTVVTHGAHRVTGQESLQPNKATLQGACRVLPQEYLHLHCQSVDTCLTLPVDETVSLLLNEIGAETANTAVVYRGYQRWMQSFHPISLPAAPTVDIKPGGIYLITGGLGDIGLTVASLLSQTADVKLILNGRSGFLEREGWDEWLAAHPQDDRISQKIHQLQELEQNGAELLILAADVGNHAEMSQLIKTATAQLGPLNGVFHTAGLLGEKAFKGIDELNPDSWGEHFQSKVQGLFVLEDVLSEQPLDFCLLFSSISAVLGGLGHIEYAAANAFMDAFAQANQNSGPWMSINWDVWRFGDQAPTTSGLGATLLNLALSPEEGASVLTRLLRLQHIPQILISTGDLAARLKQWSQVPHERADKQNGHHTLYDRPQLITPFVPPRDEVEEVIANVWQALMGIDQIGIHDNFFELGGHSLLATQVIARLRQTFRVELPLRTIFEQPTIANTAAALVAGEPRPGYILKVARLRQQTDSMTPEEVYRVLKEKKEGSKV